jgi:hypothetical protein
MKALFLLAVLIGGQAITMQTRPVVHLKPNKNQIEEGFDGSLLELVQSPPVVTLPSKPPAAGQSGNAWSVDVKNLGPGAVIVEGKGFFHIPVAVGQTVHIVSDGSKYSATH